MQETFPFHISKDGPSAAIVPSPMCTVKELTECKTCFIQFFVISKALDRLLGCI